MHIYIYHFNAVTKGESSCHNDFLLTRFKVIYSFLFSKYSDEPVSRLEDTNSSEVYKLSKLIEL